MKFLKPTASSMITTGITQYAPVKSAENPGHPLYCKEVNINVDSGNVLMIALQPIKDSFLHLKRNAYDKV